jgi:hypothetical protein
MGTQFCCVPGELSRSLNTSDFRSKKQPTAAARQRQNLRKTAFDDAVAASFADLIQIALLEAKRRGLYVAATSDEAQRLFARKIIQAVEAGERDAGKLLETMLQSLRMRTRLNSSQS